MIADFARTFVHWFGAVAAVFWSGMLVVGWIAGLSDRYDPDEPAATNREDRSK